MMRDTAESWQKQQSDNTVRATVQDNLVLRTVSHLWFVVLLSFYIVSCVLLHQLLKVQLKPSSQYFPRSFPSHFFSPLWRILRTQQLMLTS